MQKVQEVSTRVSIFDLEQVTWIPPLQADNCLTTSQIWYRLRKTELLIHCGNVESF